MPTSRHRLSEEKNDKISSNSESSSEVTINSTDYSSDSDDTSNDHSSQQAATVYIGTWIIGQFHPKKLTFSSTSRDYTSIVSRKLKGDSPIDFFCLYFDEELVEMIVD